MRATLFDDDIDAYEDMLEHNKEYQISNAPIKRVDERYAKKPGEFQMSFNGRALIEPLGDAGVEYGPEYQNISSIPRTATNDDRFDILAIVIYIKPLRQVTPANSDRKVDVREIVITDYSTNQLMTISAWNDLAIKDCDALDKALSSLPVVAFTSLKVTGHKGFSLSTTMSTMIILDREGEKAKNLHTWAVSNTSLLAERKAQVEKVRTLSNERAITTFAEIKCKKAGNTLQEECRHWLRVVILNLTNKDVRLYLGCSRCSKRSDRDKGVVFECACNKRDCTSVPKMSMNFEATDSAGSMTFTMTFTAFTGNVEKLYDMTHMEHISFLGKVAIDRMTEPFYI